MHTDLYTWSVQTKKHLETATVFAVTVGTTHECEVALILDLYHILTLKYLLMTCSSLEPIEDTVILSVLTRN